MRQEQDSMGAVFVPDEALYGAQTQRSLTFFSIGSHTMPTRLIRSFLVLKKVCARVNHTLGLFDDHVYHALNHAFTQVDTIDWKQHFPLSIWQTGSGTQTNMNINEVLANLANQAAGKPLGSKAPVHPNDHVNRSQSSNDTFPTATHMAVVGAIHETLIPALKTIHTNLEKKATQFQGIIKVGRTHLMDAVPITLSQEFHSYAHQIEQNLQRIHTTLPDLYELALGGTAVGTGLNAPKDFGPLCAAHIAQETGYPFVTGTNKFSLLSSKDPLVFFHAALKTLACTLNKLANDIRWYGSGPRCGIAEMQLPQNEPGSSIMPGKVNPTQCEAMAMVCAQVMGNDATVAFAASQGAFQLNVYKPVIAHNILESVELLSDVMNSFATHLLEGLKPNQEQIQHHLEHSLMLVTALAPYVGYDVAAQVAHHAYEKNISLQQAADDLGVMNPDTFAEKVNPKQMVGPEI